MVRIGLITYSSSSNQYTSDPVPSLTSEQLSEILLQLNEVWHKNSPYKTKVGRLFLFFCGLIPISIFFAIIALFLLDPLWIVIVLLVVVVTVVAVLYFVAMPHVSRLRIKELSATLQDINRRQTDAGVSLYLLEHDTRLFRVPPSVEIRLNDVNQVSISMIGQAHPQNTINMAFQQEQLPMYQPPIDKLLLDQPPMYKE